ncbi:MAG: hypothetical protein ACRD0P_17120 [Stackebrandtia sp.]
MPEPRDVAGGDLNSLWRVANIALPTVENVYYEQAKKVHEVNDPPDEQKYGKCHPWWTALACQLEEALFQSATSLNKTTGALQSAVEQYSHVAEEIDGEMNQVGRELQDMLESQGSEAVDAGPPGGYSGPNHNLPESRPEVHDD